MLRVGGKARDRVCGARTLIHRVMMEARETVSSMPGTSSGLGSGGGTFVCACCGLEMTYEYKGRCPPYEKNIAFLEDGYFRADPFAERRRPLFIGADCTLCRRPVCAQPTCSLFYTRRFCASCAKRNEEAFPDEMKRDLGKLQAMSPPPGYFDAYS